MDNSNEVRKKNRNNELVLQVANTVSLSSFLSIYASNHPDEAYMDFNEPVTKGFSRLRQLVKLAKDMFIYRPVIVLSLCGDGYRLRVRHNHLYE